MQARRDEYNFDLNPQESRVPPEYSLPPEYPPTDEEDSVAPEDTLSSEFNEAPARQASSKSGDSRRDERHNRLKRLLFLPAASALAAVSIVLSAFEQDPLGSDFLTHDEHVIHAEPAQPSEAPKEPTDAPQPPTEPPKGTQAASEPAREPQAEPEPSAEAAGPKESVAPPDVDGVVTELICHVTCQPGGEEREFRLSSDPDSGQKLWDGGLPDDSSTSSIRDWIAGMGCDFDSMVLYDYELTHLGQHMSDDAVYVGDEDNMDNALIISGSMVDTYRLEVFYEAYPAPDYTDSFPVLPNLEPDPENYSWSDMGTEDYIRLLDPNVVHGEPNAYLRAGTYWTSPYVGAEVKEVPGMSYDESTNTLTLDNYSSDEILDVNLMGNGFKIRLVGDNHLGSLLIWGAMHGGSVTITGSGSLTLNESGASAGAGLVINAEESASCLMIDRQATLEVFGNPAIRINSTTLEQAIYTLRPITVTGGTPASGAFDSYSWPEKDEDGNYVFDENGNVIVGKGDVNAYSEYVGMPLYDYSVVDEDGNPSRHVIFSPGK